MLKLNASYSKKIPAGKEYSSQSYHAPVEVVLPVGLSPDQLQTRLHETFDLVRSSGSRSAAKRFSTQQVRGASE